MFLCLEQLLCLLLTFLFQLILLGILIGTVELVIGVPIERNETVISLVVYEVSLLPLPIVVDAALLRISSHETVEE